MKRLIFIMLITAAPVLAQDRPHITIAQGEVAGVRTDGVDAYKNVPFAAPPVGDLRWRAPAPPLPWAGVRDAAQFGPACMQQDANPQAPWSIEFFIGPPYSEDCLSLNIWTTPGTGKAVALFVPGGGFSQGGGAETIYDGAGMAKAGIVFVTMNYRLSAAGFLTHPELDAEAGHSGNYALMDVIAALHWIQGNIAAFGGDPSRVTVMGQSAGAQAINLLLRSPQAKGLFQGAILDSGVRGGGTLPTSAEREAMAGDWARSHGAQTLAQMRALPADALVPVRGAPYRFGPTLDGHVVAGDASVVDVPVLTGWNGGEGSVGNGRLLTTIVSRDAFRKQLDDSLGSDADAALNLYPGDPTAAAQAQGHDALMMGGAAWIGERTKRMQSPVFYYDFEHVMPGDTAADWGSYHSSELPYILHTLNALQRPYTAADHGMADILQGYWVNFIKFGDPNGREAGALPHWDAFDPRRNQVMALGDKPHMRPITKPARARLFQRHAARK